jgi:hypothetical protein
MEGYEGWIALALYVTYRAGWMRGSRRMAGAIGGRPMGMQAVRSWWARRKAPAAGGLPEGVRAMSPEEFREMVTAAGSGGNGSEVDVPRGQYL